MRLSQWRAKAPARESMTAKVMAVVEPVLASLGAGGDPEVWVAWGEEPAARYTILAPTAAGLVTCSVRVSLPGEGPRAVAKLVRWNRVQLGELAVETQGGRRLLSFQAEGVVLRGVDKDADHVGAFALALFDAVDGRSPGRPTRGGRPRAGASSAGKAKPKTRAAGAGSKKPA